MLSPGIQLQPESRPRAAEAYGAADFDHIYDEHFELVWRTLRRFGVPEAQLEDAAQEVFVVVYRRLAEFEGRSSLKTWLLGIALRVASTQRRTQGRRSPPPRGGDPLPEADEFADERQASPHDECAHREAVRLMYQLLEALDEDRRAVLMLAELEQLTVPEIAAALGLNVNTAYTRLRAARQDFEKAVARVRARDGWRLR